MLEWCLKDFSWMCMIHVHEFHFFTEYLIFGFGLLALHSLLLTLLTIFLLLLDENENNVQIPTMNEFTEHFLSSNDSEKERDREKISSM